MIDMGCLERGDTLVMDLAAIHSAKSPELADLFASYGIEPVYLPNWSPELNPCEYVFARLKHFFNSFTAVNWDVTTKQHVSRTFEEMIFAATAHISHETMRQVYRNSSVCDPTSVVYQRLDSGGHLHTGGQWYERVTYKRTCD